jgi:shikimate kinase
MTRPIALVGLMGAGKSSVARILGQRLGVPAVDLDLELEAESGGPIARLFAQQGEAAFRNAERAALERVLAAGAQVLACGGGVVLDPSNRALLRSRCRTVWLEVAPLEAARRVASDDAARPLLAQGRPEERLNQLLGARAALYAEACELRVATDARTPEEVAAEVLRRLEAGL